jgi:hypothetical protein
MSSKILQLAWLLDHMIYLKLKNKVYRISSNSFRGNYSVLNLEIVEISNTVLLHIVSSETETILF